MFELPETLVADLICTGCFGIIFIILVAFGIKAIDKTWTKLDLLEQVQEGNVSAGVVLGSLSVGLCIGLALIVKGILG